MAPHIVMMGSIVLSNPTANPDTIVVAGPDLQLSAISFIGLPEVKYSLSIPINVPARRPAMIDQKLDCHFHW